MNRPSKSVQIAFRVTPEEKGYLEKEADERNLKLSEYLRAVSLGLYTPVSEDIRKSA